MTGRAAIDSTHEPAGDGVLRVVSAARGRLRLVTTIRLVAIAGPSGVGAGAAAALAGWAPAWTPIATGLLGAAAATAWGAAHTPPAATVARILDAHLDLKDRVAAALELRESGAPVAALVARDAMARLAGVRLRALFPMTIDRAPAIATAVAVALSAWLASSSTDPVRSTGQATFAGRSEADGADSTRGRGTARASAAGSSEQDATEPGPTTVREPRSLDVGNPAPREAGLATGAAPSARTATPVSGTPGGSPTAGAHSSETASTPSPAAPAARSGRGGSAAGQTPNGAVEAGAGGTAPGNAQVDIARDALAGAATQRSAATYRAARAGAEAALARDVIPPDYREHVRAYFGTLPAGGRGDGGPR